MSCIVFWLEIGSQSRRNREIFAMLRGGDVDYAIAEMFGAIYGHHKAAGAAYNRDGSQGLGVEGQVLAPC